MKNQNHKRQLLAGVLVGNVEELRKYQQEQTRQQNSPFRGWIINDTTTGRCYGTLPDGSQQDLTMSELEQLPNRVWHIVDHTKGLRVPEPDEE